MHRMFRAPPPRRLVFDAAARVRHKRRNVLHSVLLLGGMAAILWVSAWSLWGAGVAFWAVVGGLLGFLLTPGMAPGWVMRAYRARPLDRRSFPEGIAMVEALAARAGLDHVPRLHLLPSATLNAFAVGSAREAAIGVTAGLLRALDARELAGVLAHELSHVRNNDLWLMALADTMSRLTSLMATMGLFLAILSLPLLLLGMAPVPLLTLAILVLAPTIGSLLQLALSRAREFDADLEAVTLTRDPAGLASALRKLDRYQGAYWEEIVLPGRRMPEPSLLRSHPPTAERIERLLSLYGDAGHGDAGEPPTAGPLRHTLPAGLAQADPPRYRRLGFWY